MRNDIDRYIKENKNYVFSLAMDISQIPSMTGCEEKKAEFIMKKLFELCKERVWQDEAGNVLYMHDEADSEKICIYAAHIDTVFDNIRDIEPYIKGNRIYAPSIWDNSINIAALIFVIKMIVEIKISFDKNILFAFDIGEEGYGNLKGVKHIVGCRKDNIEEVIAVDLGYESVINAAAGSKRYSVTVETEGGHSWSDFGKANAISEASGIIKDLYDLKVSDEPKTTYNVGVIKGGTSVNTIAQKCKFDIDIRSEDEGCLKELEQKFLNILKKYQKDGVKIKSSLTGERPCGKLPCDSSLMKRIIDTRKELGLEMKYHSGSTDANIPLSMGIPAVSFGVCNGSGAHTTNEYIEMDSLETGMKQLIYFMLKE